MYHNFPCVSVHNYVFFATYVGDTRSIIFPPIVCTRRSGIDIEVVGMRLKLRIVQYPPHHQAITMDPGGKDFNRFFKTIHTRPYGKGVHEHSVEGWRRFRRVYEAYLQINGREIKVALKQVQPCMLKDERFVKVDGLP